MIQPTKNISNTISIEGLLNLYTSGRRTFENITLRNADFQGLDLRYINFKNSDLSYSNFSDTILYGANLEKTNLFGIKGNNAQLQGVFLSQATMACANLNYANLTDADLREVNLDAVSLKKAILVGADLSDAHLFGAELQSAILTGAYISNNTHFDNNVNLESCQMKLRGEISLEDLLQKFHYLTEQGIYFLGPKLTAKNWEKSRPHFDWLNNLIINSSAQIVFSEDTGKSISNLERHWAQKWMNSFINQCSVIIRDFSTRVDHQKIIF